MMKLSSRAGFTVIQLIISSVIATLLILALTQFLSTAKRSQVLVQNAVDFDLLKTSLNQIFNTKACNGSLMYGGTPVTFSFPAGMALDDDIAPSSTGFLIDEIHHGTQEIVRSGVQLAGGLTVTKLAIVSAVYNGVQKIGAIQYKAFSSLLRVELTKSEASGPVKTFRTNPDIAVRLLANASTGVVDHCGSASNLNVSQFVSGEINIPNTSAHTVIQVDHGLDDVPTLVKWVAVCKVAQYGYAVGDEIDLMTTSNPGADTYHSRAYFQNSTKVGLSWYDPQSYYIRAIGKASGGNTLGEELSSPQWVLKVYAYKFGI